MKTISDKEHNMDDKKVAVLLSTYNGEKYLREQLDSIENQTYKNIQIVIRDDGSHDNTVEIINEYSKKYGNVKFIHGKNKGFIKSFFKLLEYSDADYFAYADQDDIDNPDDVPAQQQAKNSCEEFSFLEACYSSKQPRSYRNNCENYTDKPRHSEIVFTFLSH